MSRGNPRSRRDRQCRAYERRKRYALAYLGGKCEACGSTSGLEIDHVDCATKSFDLFGPKWSTRWERWCDELEKCQLLCHCCHNDKTQEDKRTRLRRIIEHARELQECPF